MKNSGYEAERRKLLEIAADYEGRGYEVLVEPSQENFEAVIGRDMSFFSKQDEDMNMQCKVHEVLAPRIKRPTSICELTGLT